MKSAAHRLLFLLQNVKAAGRQGAPRPRAVAAEQAGVTPRIIDLQDRSVMAEKRRFLDVWIVEANTVYREVPFDVVADWVQQGRLLEDDMLRPSGTADWRRLGDFMRLRRLRAQAGRRAGAARAPVEPVEPVETGLHLAQAVGAGRQRSRYDPADRRQPRAADLLHADNEGRERRPAPSPDAARRKRHRRQHASDSAWVGIDLEGDGPNRTPIYSCGAGGSGAKDADSNLHSQAELLVPPANPAGRTKDIDLTINANPDVNTGDVRRLTIELSKNPFRSEIRRNVHRRE